MLTARISLGLALVTLLVVASPAQAARVTYGSDLSAPATIAYSTPNDSVFWNEAIMDPRGPIVGVTGQVIEVSVKGRIVPSQQTLAGGGNPFNTIHFQVLRPNGDGGYHIPSDGGTSTDYHMPWTGDDNQITTWETTRQYDALCVKPGYRVDFATLGGFDYANGYNDGTPFKIFGRVPGSRFLQYSAAGTEGVHNGTTIKPQYTRNDQELLMRFVVGTGDDARYSCQTAEEQAGGGGTSGGGGGGGSTPAGPRVTLPRQNPHLRKRHILSVAAYCHLKTAPCRGKLTARARGKLIGSTGYRIAAGDTEGVRFRFNATGRKLFRRSGNRLKVRITVVTEPGGAANTDSRTLRITRS